MSILPGRNSILINPVMVLISGMRPGCIDSVFIPQRAVQSRAVPAPLPQGEGQQLLQPFSLVAVTIHL